MCFRLYLNYVPIHRTILGLRQRLNFRGPGVLAAQPPVFQQLFSMYHRPFLDQA